MRLRIHGGGIAELTCARLAAVGDHDVEVVTRPASPGSGPVRPRLVLNDVCLSLLGELFPDIDWRSQGHPLLYRQVMWGGEPPITRPERSVTLGGERLRALIEQDCRLAGLRLRPEPTCAGPPTDWVINAPDDREGEVLTGGRRRAWLATALLREDAADDRYYVESVPDGWLLLVPQGAGRAYLQATSPTATSGLDRLLHQSWLVAAQIRDTECRGQSACAPYLRLPLQRPGRLRIGKAAMGFDPVSGEGTPLALRQGILLAAALDAGPDRQSACLAHYEQRLQDTFLAHLQGCMGYYRDSFPDHPDWQQEIRDMLDSARALLDRHRKRAADLDYKLVRSHGLGAKLVPVPRPAAVNRS